MTTPLDEERLLAAAPNKLLIAGEWVDAGGGASFEVHDPATGAAIATVADASVTDGLRAVEAAAQAQSSWAATPPRERAEILHAAFDLLRERREDVALLITLEMGKPLAEARTEVAYGGEFLRWFAEEAVRIQGRYGTPPEAAGIMTVAQRPVGPCYLITPWNFPLAMATRKIAPALAAGCTAVIKPSELTPLTTLLFAQLLVEAGLPPGVLNVIPTTAAGPVSDAILADSRLRKLSFTGSTPVGVSLIKRAADNVLRTSMELGGNAPFLVFEDADIDAAVQGALVAKFRNIGQSCTAANRFLVHESLADEFCRRLTEHTNHYKCGRGTDPQATIGPLIDNRAVAKVTRLVDDALANGGMLCSGGRALDGDGNFYLPTVLSGVSTDAQIFEEEIFGPVISITPFTDEQDAVAKANSTTYGLVAYAYTQSLARAQRLVDSLETGMMGLNTGVVSNAAAPFGGVKHSGLGREGGFEGIHEYLEPKYVLSA